MPTKQAEMNKAEDRRAMGSLCTADTGLKIVTTTI